MSIVAALAFVVLLLLFVPVAHALLLAGGFAMAAEEPLFLFEAILNLYQPTSSFPMLAIPFFILAGDLMMSGRFGYYLIRLAKMLVGAMRGGLAQVSVLGSLFFGGVSGSAVADASALGNALIPVQKKQRYPPGYAAAVNAASSTISVLIPPSIPLILYGLITETSIPRLFVAGIVPGLALTLLLLATCGVIARIRNLPASPDAFGIADLFDKRDAVIIAAANCMLVALALAGAMPLWALVLLAFGVMLVHTCFVSRRFRWRNISADMVGALPALMMPLMILFLARGGVATPTEISVFAVGYALVIGVFVYRDLTFAVVLRSVLTAGMMTGVIMLIIMSSSVLQWILSYESVPERMARFMLEELRSPWAIIAGMNVVMIVIGAFLDLPAAVLLLAPIFAVVAAQIGMDTVQLGIMMVVNLAIGLYTPPVGTTLFVSVAIERVSIGKAVRHLLPFYLVALLILGAVSYIPEFTLLFR